MNGKYFQSAVKQSISCWNKTRWGPISGCQSSPSEPIQRPTMASYLYHEQRHHKINALLWLENKAKKVLKSMKCTNKKENVSKKTAKRLGLHPIVNNKSPYNLQAWLSPKSDVFKSDTIFLYSSFNYPYIFRMVLFIYSVHWQLYT